MKAPHSSTSSSNERGRRALYGVCWAVALIFAVDLLCRVFLPGGELVELEDITRDRAESEAAPDIQVIGDSVSRSGFLSGALGNDQLTVRNDSMPASGAPKTYLLLERQFEKGHVPRVLVIAHSPHTFERVRYEVLVGGFAHWSEIPGLAKYAKHWTDVLYGAMTKLSYLLMHRDSIQDLLKKGDASFFTDNEPQSFLPPDLERLRDYGPRLAAGEFSNNRLASDASDYFHSPFTVAPMNDAYFRKILALAKRHNVMVFWVTMPTPRQVMKARATVNYEQDMLKYLRQFERPGEFEILQGPFSIYPGEMFRDMLHLNEAGAVNFACELETIKNRVISAAQRSQAEKAQTTHSSIAGDEFRTQLVPYCKSLESSHSAAVAAH